MEKSRNAEIPQKSVELSKENNTQKRLQKLKDNIEQNEILNNIPQEEYLEILENFGNLDNYHTLYDDSISRDDFRNILKSKKNNHEITTFLKDLGFLENQNYALENTTRILKTQEYKDILAEVQKYGKSKPHLNALNIYHSHHSIQNDEFDIQTQSPNNSLNTLKNEKFGKFLQELEEYFGEKITEDLSYFENIFTNHNNLSDIFYNEKSRENFKKGTVFLKQLFPELSFSQRWGIVLSNFNKNSLNESFEKNILIKKQIIENFKNLNCHISHDDLVSFLTDNIHTNYLNTTHEKLQQHIKYGTFLGKTDFGKKISHKELSNIINYTNHYYAGIVNNSETERFITSIAAEWENGSVNTGINTMKLLEKISDDIKDYKDENPQISEEDIIANFEKFIQSQKDTKTIQAIFLSWENFTKQKFDSRIIETKNSTIESIKLLFPKNKFLLANNYGHLQEYKEQADINNLYDFVKKFEKNQKVEIDYIPTPQELKNHASIVKKIINNINTTLSNTTIKLSDAFLVATNDNLKELLQNPKNITKIKNLATLYNINISDFRSIIPYNLNPEVGVKVNYNKNSIDFMMTHLLNTDTYNFYTNQKDHILKNIFINKNNITFEDLYNYRVYQSNDIYINQFNNTEITSKLHTLGLSHTEIRNLLSFDNQDDDISENAHENLYFQHLLKTNHEQVEIIIDFAINFQKDFIQKTPLYQDIYILLWIFADISANKSRYFDGNLDKLKSSLIGVAQNKVKFQHPEEVLFYLRTLKYDSHITETLKNPEFQKLFDKFSNTYYNGGKNITSMLLCAEIFNYAQRKNNGFLEKLQNGDFSEINTVLKYFEEKYKVTGNHPFLVASATHFVDNFETTKSLVSELENKWEIVKNNYLASIATVGKIITAHPEKKEFFFNKDQLSSYLTEAIYKKASYERPNIETVTATSRQIIQTDTDNIKTNDLQEHYNNLKNNYTERPDLNTLSLVELWHTYVVYEGSKNINTQQLKHYIITDGKDTTTEFGGIITFDYNKEKWIESHFFYGPTSK